jgi:hypothetical protein
MTIQGSAEAVGADPNAGEKNVSSRGAWTSPLSECVEDPLGLGDVGEGDVDADAVTDESVPADPSQT